MPKRRSWVLDVRICWIVLIAFSSLSLIPVNGNAALVPSLLADGSRMTERASQIETIRQVLEKEVVAQRLADYGLTVDEVAAKLPTLSDEQLHQLNSLSEDIVAGDGVGLIIGILVIIILVIVIVKLMGKDIIIR
jgi:hypothetical protein